MFLFNKTKQLVLKRFNLLPQIAIITGSGVELFTSHKPSFEIKYSELPIWSSSKKHSALKIKGHEGKLKLYKIKKKSILVFSGRKHLYEGVSITDVIKNIRLAYELGIKKIIITNAAGGIKGVQPYAPTAEDLMLITGFIDLIQPTERGILNGITQPPAKIKSKLNSKLKTQSSKLGLKKGIYAGVLGPSYETYSEIKLLQLLGASAVGMSTVPELICAKSLSMDYAAISVISNVWGKKHKPSHEMVLKNVKKANKKLSDLILKLLDCLP